MAFDILKIGKYLECPFKIMDHMTTCLFFWGLDWLFHAIWGIVWVMMLCMFVSNITGCYTVEPNDICPSWPSFANFIENIMQTFTGSKFLYRDDGDMDNCYCVDPLPQMFDPLRYYSNYYSDTKSSQNSSNGATLLIPIIVFGLLYSYNKKKI